MPRSPRPCSNLTDSAHRQVNTGTRACLLSIAVFIFAGFCFGQAAGSRSSSGTPTRALTTWSEFHRPNMTRWSKYENVLNVHNVGSLVHKWSYVTSVGSSPTVADGVVYVGSDDFNVYALNAHTGAKLWSYATGDTVDSSPAVANGVVYVGSQDSNVYALNAHTGAKLWSYTTGAPVISSPTVANGVVYVGSGDFNVYALDASTGTKLWSYTTGNNVTSSPAVANGVVYVGSWDNNVYALNASTGAKQWSYAAASVVTSSPAVANGVVYVGSWDFNVYALNVGLVLLRTLPGVNSSLISTSTSGLLVEAVELSS